MKMPPPLRNGIYAAYSAAFSRMLSERTPGRAVVAAAAPAPVPLGPAIVVSRKGPGNRSATPRQRAAARADARRARVAAIASDDSERGTPAPPGARESSTPATHRGSAAR